MASNAAAPTRGSLVLGLSIPQADPDAAEVLKTAREDGFDFVTTALPSRLEPRPDVRQLQGRWWRTSIVGIVSATSSVEELFEVLPSQLEWAAHMGIPAVILPAPPSTTSDLMEYARIIQSVANEQAKANNIQLWVRTAMTDASLESFQTLYQLCDGPPNLGMILTMVDPQTMTKAATQTAASVVAEKIRLLHHACGSQLKALSFPTNVFLTNKGGFPTMAKSHQVLFTEILKRLDRTLRVLVEGPSVHRVANAENSMGATGCLPYLQYIQHIRKRPDLIILDSESAVMETPYLDSLQRPLEPLKDHLEFSMYETFEKDPVKYAQYQSAVFLALQDGLREVPPGAPRQIVIAVAGSGRGPLVTSSIQAFIQLNAPSTITLKVFAVEKNPSAVVYLKSMAQQEPKWQNIVQVVHADARSLTREMLDGNQIDLVVSELLGSFGDNELSPECLDPFLASECCKSSTISIPMSYTALLAPVTSMRLHAEARKQAQMSSDGDHSLGIQQAMETPYVVRSHAASQTHIEKNCWSFEHPAKQTNQERAATLEFGPDATMAAPSGCGYGVVDSGIAGIVSQCATSQPSPVTLHGLLGSFTAILYESKSGQKSVISIAPHAFSEGMFSWFPLYFPFREPLRVPSASSITVKMWRKTSLGRVWYEWCAQVHRGEEILGIVPIHNSNGRSSHVSM